jgi:hypothetical protein
VLALHQPLRAGEPSSRTLGFAAKEHVVADPKGAAHCTLHVRATEVRSVRALERRHVVIVTAEHVGRPCQQLEVIAAQGLQPVGSRQLVVRIRPGVLGEPLSPAFQQHRGIHKCGLSLVDAASAGAWSARHA